MEDEVDAWEEVDMEVVEEVDMEEVVEGVNVDEWEVEVEAGCGVGDGAAVGVVGKAETALVSNSMI